MVENEEQEPLRGEEALKLAREGKDAWNAWAEENPDRTVDFQKVDFTSKDNRTIFFEDFTFPGFVHFSGAKFPDAWFGGATFKGYPWFNSATFEGHAWFDGATFKEDAWFDGATFERDAWFGEATFKDTAEFTGTTFAGPVNLNGSRFQIPPDFRRTDFKKHVTLHGMGVDFRQPAGLEDADKYRRLKELAVNARDHEREQEFFANELKAKREHEKRWLARMPTNLYESLSDFGRSLGRPFGWLLGVWFGFGALYSLIASKDWSHLLDGLSFSAANLFPFLGASQGARGDVKAALFGKDAALDVLVNGLAMLEGLLGILFLFLIGLALRNRFRI